MGLTKPKEYKKPKLRKDDPVFLVDMPNGPETFQGKVTVVDSVKDGKVKVKGDDTLFSDEGIAPFERAILIPAAIRASMSRSPFLRNTAGLGSLVLNKGMLDSIDAENEKLA